MSKCGPHQSQKLSRLEKTVAANMQTSWSEIPHAWVSKNIDISELELARKRLKLQADTGV